MKSAKLIIMFMLVSASTALLNVLHGDTLRQLRELER